MRGFCIFSFSSIVSHQVICSDLVNLTVNNKMARYDLYKTKRWEGFREYIISQRNEVCERCGNAGWVVHHREYINDVNVNDMNIVFGEDNAELLCQDCHNREHHIADSTAAGLVFTGSGELIAK